jgi:heptosyltransferase-3
MTNGRQKILVIQLARLGDIFQTWPTLRGLKRHDPFCEIHFLTRTKFASSITQIPAIDHHWQLDTRSILSPLIDEVPDISTSLGRLTALTDHLRNEAFDRVINLSFSPFSSHLTREIAVGTTDLRGYTRFNDGYLCIPDDGSAYFYAQVGPERSNRVHVTDLFAHIAGIELQREDWTQPEINEEACASDPCVKAGEDGIVVHVGASDPSKTFDWTRWARVVKSLLNRTESRVILVGGADEIEIGSRIAQMADSSRVVNLVGRTTVPELIEIIRRACLVIGGDSAPVQIASLTGTLVLNLSFPIVSFWETGPRSANSRILPVKSPDAISSDAIVDEAVSMLAKQPAVSEKVIRVPGPTMPLLEAGPSESTFEWEMLKALYMGDAFPAPPDEIFLLGMQRLSEVNRLAREQIETLRKQANNKTAAAILDQVDEIIEQIRKFVPQAGPMVRWFQTERLRLGPMPVNELIEATDSLHAKFGDVLALYDIGNGHLNSEGGSGDSFIMG